MKNVTLMPTDWFFFEQAEEREQVNGGFQNEKPFALATVAEVKGFVAAFHIQPEVSHLSLIHISYEVPEAIAPYLKDHDCMLLENHGALTVGDVYKRQCPYRTISHYPCPCRILKQADHQH